MLRANNPDEGGEMIIDLRKMDEITPKGCQGFLTRIMPSLRDLDAVHGFLSLESYHPFGIANCVTSVNNWKA
jgi:hypothetical protein